MSPLEMTSIVPIGVIAAVMIFLIKEVMEFSRRKKADNRKKKAIRIILANECERSNFSINTIRYIAEKIDDIDKLLLNKSNDIHKTDNPEVKVYKDASGASHLRLKFGEKSHTSILIADVQKSIIEKYIMDIATVDEKAFDKTMKAYESIVNLHHIQSRIISIASEEGQLAQLISFIPHAKESLDECYNDISALYRECAGRELTNQRVAGRTFRKREIKAAE